MNTPVIEVRNFCKRFTLHQQGGVVINALDNVSFSVSAGECLALSGPSGAGKSTMLKALYGNYLPSSGEILVRTDAGTIDIGKASPRTVMKLRLGVISFVTQFLRVIPRVTELSLVSLWPRPASILRRPAAGPATCSTGSTFPSASGTSLQPPSRAASSSASISREA